MSDHPAPNEMPAAKTATCTGHISDIFGLLKRDGQISASIDEINHAIADGWAGIGSQETR